MNTRQMDVRRAFAIPAALTADEAAERDARRAPASSAPAGLTRIDARGRSRRAFALPLRFSLAATGLITAAIALALYLRF